MARRYAHSTPEEAIASFLAEVERVCKAPEVQRDQCCMAILKKKKPKARACPDCGTRFAKRDDYDIQEWFTDMWEADVDGFCEAAFPFNNGTSEETMNGQIGLWRFFPGFPVDDNVVVIQDILSLPHLEYAVRHAGPSLRNWTVYRKPRGA